MPSTRPYLRRLAAKLGIIPSFIDATGVRRVTSDATRVALIEAMGYEARPEKAAKDSLRRFAQEKEADQVIKNSMASLAERPDAQRCWRPREGAGTGVHLNLYSLRSRRSWGVGDLTDLATVVRWARAQGGSFVGLNPLHALRNQRPQVSPYSPLSRIFLNPLYIDVEAVPEFGRCESARKLVASSTFQRSLNALRGQEQLNYSSILSLKYRVLRLLHAEFKKRLESGSPRQKRAYWDFTAAALEEFAIFCALDEYFERTRGLTNWRRWPAQYQDRWSSTVSDFRDEHETEIAFYKWLQYELDRQLSSNRKRERNGTDAFLYQDIAVGSIAGGFDAWSFGELFVSDVELGCPPDAYSSTGQNWSFPPINPWALRKQCYHYWRCVLQSAMRHAGMVRIDHAMGLMRQYWIPRGRPATEGAYVRYPVEDLVGILAMQSHYHKTMVIGEDLGTVPKGFADLLERWGIYSTRVMMFERGRSGAFKPAASYRANALTSATNHDLPPLKGFLAGSDLALRKRLRLFRTQAAWREALAKRQKDIAALMRRLVAEGLLTKSEASDVQSLRYERVLGAVHGFLARTPSKLVAVMLDDLFGETEPINLPGVGPEKHASWTRRMTMSLEEGLNGPAIAASFRAAMRKKSVQKKPRKKKIRRGQRTS